LPLSLPISDLLKHNQIVSVQSRRFLSSLSILNKYHALRGGYHECLGPRSAVWVMFSMLPSPSHRRDAKTIAQMVAALLLWNKCRGMNVRGGLQRTVRSSAISKTRYPQLTRDAALDHDKMQT